MTMEMMTLFMFLSLVTLVTIEKNKHSVKILSIETSEIYIESLIIEIFVLALSIFIII